MKNVAVVPVKGLSEAKRRLSAHLSPEERKRLVGAMLLDVLEALNSSEMFDQVLIMSPDESVAGLVEGGDAIFLLQRGTGLNSAVQQATRLALQRGALSLTTVLADLPLAQHQDFEELLNVSKTRPRVVMAPSLKGGTNVMLRAPPDAIANSYGRWSYAKHLRTAQLKGITVYSISNNRLAFDVDTMDDIRLLRHDDQAGRTNTGRLLRELPRVYPLVKSR